MANIDDLMAEIDALAMEPPPSAPAQARPTPSATAHDPLADFDLDALLADVPAQSATKPAQPPTGGQMPRVVQLAPANTNASTAMTGPPMRTGPMTGPPGMAPMTGPPMTGPPMTGPPMMTPMTGPPMMTPMTGPPRMTPMTGPVTGPMTGPGRVGPMTGPGVAGPAGVPARQGAGAEGMATHTPDGRKIVHNGPPCYVCKKPCMRVLNALGRTYCGPSCFVCFSCSQPIAGGRFVEHESEPYCANCHAELYLPRCSRCQMPIRDTVIKALGQVYHKDHFVCTGCGTSLVGVKYRESGGEAYCTVCIESVKIDLAPDIKTCGKCKKPILGEYLTLKGQFFHPEHFACVMCGCALSGSNSRVHEGRFYCAEDYEKVSKDVCAGCQMPIVGRSITALGRLWHPEHFVCAFCEEPFNGASHYEHSGKAYCGPHYQQLFGEMCSLCNAPVSIGAIHFLTSVFHSGCFQCAMCQIVLKSGMAVQEFQLKPHCQKCYLKLPTSQRKQYENMRKKEQEEDEKRGKLQEKEDKKKKKEFEKKAKDIKKERDAAKKKGVSLEDDLE